MNFKKELLIKRIYSYSFLVLIFVTFWGCEKEISVEESEAFTHNCRLQKSALNFNDFTGLDCSIQLSESCFHQYFYNENNLIVKRVKNSSGSIYEFEIDSIAYDEFGRVKEEHSFGRDSVGTKFLEIVRIYFFNNDSDITPKNSERYWVNEDGTNTIISSEEYIFQNERISELSFKIDGQIMQTESFVYDDDGNLAERLVEFFNNETLNSRTNSYSNYDDMINPIRKFPFRDLFGIRNSINNYMQIRSVRVNVLGEATLDYAFFIERLNYNGLGYPIIGLMEYDCD